MTDEPVKDEKPMPPSPNPDLPRQLQFAAQSGNPEQALDALVAAGVVSKETRDNMVAEEVKQKAGLSILAGQIANNTEGVRFMAHAMDLFRDGVRADVLKVQRSVELIRRVLAKLPAFKETYERLEDEDKEREEVAKRSTTSAKVTTSKPDVKVALREKSA